MYTCVRTHTHTLCVGYLDVRTGVGTRHLESPKNPGGPNLGIYIFVYVYKVDIYIYIALGVPCACGTVQWSKQLVRIFGPKLTDQSKPHAARFFFLRRQPRNFENVPLVARRKEHFLGFWTDFLVAEFPPNRGWQGLKRSSNSHDGTKSILKSKFSKKRCTMLGDE